MNDRKAAIAKDDLSDKTLDQVSAAEFLSALDRNSVSITVWPEKKKLELYTEPENWGRFRFRDVFDVITSEKKKYELEKLPGFERVRDPIGERVNPAIYDRLADQIAERIAARLGR